MTLRRKVVCLLDGNSNMEYTLKDVEEMIAALDELPFVEKMGLLALATILTVFSEGPTKQNKSTIREEE